MSNMFYGASNFNHSLNSWDVSGVTNMSKMFYGASNFNHSLNSWDTSSVNNMDNMFAYAKEFNGNISHWNTSEVTSMTNMFGGYSSSSFNQDINTKIIKKEDSNIEYTAWDVSKVKSMYLMFWNSKFNSDISKWDTSAVTDMAKMFKNAANFNKDINTKFIKKEISPTKEEYTAWDVSNVKDMEFMFNGASEFDKNLIGWEFGDAKLRDIFRDSKMGKFAVEFTDETKKESVSNILNFYIMGIRMNNNNIVTNGWPYLVGKLKEGNLLKKIKIPIIDKIFRLLLRRWFQSSLSDKSKERESIISQYGYIKDWDTGEITDMSYLFSNKTNPDLELASSSKFKVHQHFNEDISKWNTSKVTDMSYMFEDTKRFNRDISAWDVSQVTDMSNMFNRAIKFNQYIGGWNVSKVTNMSNMFYDATIFNQDISEWDVSQVTNMSNMFYDAYDFDQDIGGWQVSKVTDMNNMFNSAEAFNQDIRGWDVSQVANMSNMFYGASKFNQDINRLNISRTVNLTNIFYNTGLDDNKLQNLYCNWEKRNSNIKDTSYLSNKEIESCNPVITFQPQITHPIETTQPTTTQSTTTQPTTKQSQKDKELPLCVGKDEDGCIHLKEYCNDTLTGENVRNICPEICGLCKIKLDDSKKYKYKVIMKYDLSNIKANKEKIIKIMENLRKNNDYNIIYNIK
jgi:surface protein